MRCRRRTAKGLGGAQQGFQVSGDIDEYHVLFAFSRTHLFSSGSAGVYDHSFV
jgi:hypothetical protein